MRTTFRAAVLVFALALIPVRAAEPTDARAIIDKAIQASGGAAKLAKFNSQTWDEKGVYYGMGKGLPYTGKYAVQWPDKFRMDITGVFTMVVAGDKGWMKSEKGTVEMTKDQLARERQNLYGGYVASLLPLKGKEYTLTLLPETKVDDKPAFSVKVTHAGRQVVTLYFDKATGLLAKYDQIVRPEDPKGKDVKQETTLSDYQDIDGCKLATKIVVRRDGKPYVEATTSNVKPAEKLDAKLFAKP